MPKKIKDLVAESRQPVTAHHSTWIGENPHEVNYDTSFHAGTLQAAKDRLRAGLVETLNNSDYEEGDILDAYIHSYEIPRSLISPKMHMDPDTSSARVLRHSATSRKRLSRAPEKVTETSKPQQVIPYKNSFEDKGSTSYVIPSQLVYEGRIKHLGSQFVADYTVDQDYPPSTADLPQ